MKRFFSIMAVFSAAVSIFAGDPSEKGIRTSPLTTYNGGLAAGAILSVNHELKDVSKQFLKVTFTNNVYYRENLGFFLDVDWFAAESKLKNFGADLGFDYIISNPDFHPFIGVGLGAHSFDHPHQSFGDDIGPSATIHVGFQMDISETFHVRVRVPYYVVLNEKRDNGAGLEVGFLFSDRFGKVKKLNYNEN